MMIKNYLKCYGYLFGMIIVMTLILSLINYFIKMPSIVIKTLIPIISLFISSMFLGKNIQKKGYIEGIKFGMGYLIVSMIIKIILRTGFNYKVVIIYILMLFSSIIGSMIGINTKKNK